ncbi:uncharacterized protein LOC117173394 isoform X2 [Belonocnema kinseyi]|uniref:uncharacterized protein LOC117173394 isoform X2 n=1 Tax=Belonocnema kinseyi TaxID=2817044 RepID=UPI00143DAC01|nr:uncharacterized protein LOC117173394 isoform X2 [Belonocnema kinseyi]
MGRLFESVNGTPLSFYLADLPTNHFEKYTFLIEAHGGIVEPIAKENVLTFTLQSRAYNFKFVFDVKFIEDCVDHKRILDINKYYVGDSRLQSSCLCQFSKTFCGSTSCLLNRRKASKFPESQKETSKRARDISEVRLGKKITKNVVESSSERFDRHCNINDDTELNEIDTIEIVKSRLPDSSEDAEHITEAANNNKDNFPPVPRNFKVLGSIITPEIMQWIKELNEKRPKDELGYPKKLSHTYIAWESRNLIDFVKKTNTFDMVFSESYCYSQKTEPPSRCTLILILKFWKK